MSCSKLLYSLFLFFSFASFTSSYSFLDNNTHIQCSVEETHALILFKQSLFSINDTWYESECPGYHPIMMNWNTSTNCCNWNGVTCDHSTGDVIGLDLSCGMLRGIILPNNTLFHLRHLQRLNLAFNSFFSSQLPSEIGRFSNSLTHLNITRCHFTGQVPMDITLLHKLVSLDLSSNYYFKLKPHDLNNLFLNLTNLEELSLKGVNISSVLPAGLNISSSSLKLLNLGRTGLQGKLPDYIFNLHSLETLDLSDNSFTGDIPPEISLLPKLVSLDLSDNYYLRIHPHIFNSILINSTLLKYLSLYGVNISSGLPTYLNMSSLKSLDLSYTNLQGKLPDNIFNLQYLEELYLSENNLIGSVPKSGFNLTHLTNLSGNNLIGSLPKSLVNLTHLIYLDLSFNKLTGTLPSWLFALPSLEELDLSNNQLTGHIDVQTFQQLTNLTFLRLSHNNFSGDLELDALLSSLINLSDLDLSYSGFSVTTKNANHHVNPGFRSLYLVSCKLKVFPESLRAMRNLELLDLSSNEIHGQIPHWAGEIGGNEMSFLNLSHNSITGLPQFQWYGLQQLYLQSNLIQGPFPPSICNISSLELLDMSNNSFGGVIPQCVGNITSTVGGNCQFRGLILNGNQLEGEVPSSLSKCQSLNVLDLGNNQLSGTFPSWLGGLPYLQVLILKSNNFHGHIITSSAMKFPFQSLQILDLSQNEFVGQLPANYFQNFNAMKGVVKKSTRPEYLYMGLGKPYSFILTVKGLEQDFPQVFVDYTIINLSKNKFQSEIPVIIGSLNSLIVLDLSHNILTGRIPFGFGKLLEIESLDLSCNQLSGEIPQSLTDLMFLGFLNLSENQLEGHIPQGKQFDTFEGNSFIGNPKLCGLPLSHKCGDYPHKPQLQEDEDEDGEGSGVTWEVVTLGYGCGTLLGLVMGYLMLSTRKVKWFNAIADAAERI